jgi:hypothetical protein
MCFFFSLMPTTICVTVGISCYLQRQKLMAG